MDRNAEKRSILTRAAVVEAQRQSAKSRGDVAGELAAWAELRRLWARYAALERAA